MNKITANIVLGFFDVAAILACVYAFFEWNTLYENMHSGAQVISYQAYFGVYFMTSMLPVIHVISLFKFKLVSGRIVNYSLVSVFVLLLVLVVLIEHYLRLDLDLKDYLYCSEKSNFMTFSEFKVYIKEGVSCSKI